MQCWGLRLARCRCRRADRIRSLCTALFPDGGSCLKGWTIRLLQMHWVRASRFLRPWSLGSFTFTGGGCLKKQGVGWWRRWRPFPHPLPGVWSDCLWWWCGAGLSYSGSGLVEILSVRDGRVRRWWGLILICCGLWFGWFFIFFMGCYVWCKSLTL